MNTGENNEDPGRSNPVQPSGSDAPPNPRGERLDLTPEEEADAAASLNVAFEDMRLDGKPVFEPNFSKPVKTARTPKTAKPAKK
jgi:hypothetical protein